MINIIMIMILVMIKKWPEVFWKKLTMWAAKMAVGRGGYERCCNVKIII